MVELRGMYREKEVKYDVALERDEAKLLRDVERIVLEFGFSIVPKESVTRRYEYFDTRELYAMHHSETVRKISEFTPASEKGKFRYDYKKGLITERYEENYWSNRELNEEEMRRRLKLPEVYDGLEVKARASTRHTKRVLQKNGTRIELALDHFTLEGGLQFKELELECKNGDDVKNERLGRRISDVLGLVRLEEQKYTRVMRMRGG